MHRLKKNRAIVRLGHLLNQAEAAFWGLRSDSEAQSQEMNKPLRLSDVRRFRCDQNRTVARWKVNGMTSRKR
jgi:hypothetical protein